MARIPLDPRLARIVLEADSLGCLREVLVIVSGLSIQDPRERPRENEQIANEFHARYRDPDSDFLSYLHLWDHLRIERRKRSGNQFRKMCKSEFLHFLRIREWQDVHGQLRRVCDDLGLRRSRNSAPADLVHRALLAGFLSHIGFLPSDTKPTVKEARAHRRNSRPHEAEYRGARSARFTIAPGSTLRRHPPKWIMAAELVETDRLRARVVTGIPPQWVEKAADHLLRWEWTDPWWDTDRGAAMCTERAYLHGLPVVADRRINLQRVNPEMAREMFIRNALVERKWVSPHKFLDQVADRIEEVNQLQTTLRRTDLLGDDDQLMSLYANRIPDQIVSAGHFDRWWKTRSRDEPDLFNFTLEELLDPRAGPIESDGFPEAWVHGNLSLRISYEFDQSSPTDGATIDIPVDVLTRLDPQTFIWNVPGLRSELIEHLVRSLPKQIRRTLVPIPETISQVIQLLDPNGRLVEELQGALRRARGVSTSIDDFDLNAIPTHLKPHFRIVDDHGVLAEDDDLDLLKQHIQQEARQLLTGNRHPIEQAGLTTWTIDEIPQVIETEGLGQVVRSYPALVDQGDSVSIQLLSTEIEQSEAMWSGTRRLLMLNRPSVSRTVRPLLTNSVKLSILTSPYADAEFVAR